MLPLLIENLSHNYSQNFKALNNLSFELLPNECLVFLGPNGAGKSTLTKLILGIEKIQSGSIKCFDHKAGELQALKKIGYAPQEFIFLGNLNVTEILKFVASHYDNPMSLDEALTKFSLENLKHRQAHELSGGQRRCLSLACAFIGRPQILILDEPTVGLDVDIRLKLWDEIRLAQKNSTSILLSTHYLDEAEKLADRILVMNKGKLIQSGKVSEIKKEFNYKKIYFHATQKPKCIEDLKYTNKGTHFELIHQSSDEIAKQLLSDKSVKDLEIHSLSLEEVFLNTLKQNQAQNEMA